jgi:hypothetical protein
MKRGGINVDDFNPDANMNISLDQPTPKKQRLS